MDESDVTACLRLSPLLRDASTELLALAARSGSVCRFDQGTAFVRQGDPVFARPSAAEAIKPDERWLYFVLKGSVRTEMDGLSIGTLKPGAVGGAAGILDATDASRSRTQAHVAAEANTVLLALGRHAVDQLLEHASFRNALIRSMGARMRKRSALVAQHFYGGGSAELSPAAAARTCVMAVFDTKSYDQRHLSEAFAPNQQQQPPHLTVTLKFHATKLSIDSAALAAGARAVCVFVNDDLSEPVLVRLKALGVEAVVLRCAGFNNVDLGAAQRLGFSVVRVPAYSPHAVAEHAFALLMTLNRHTHLAYQRVRDGNFALQGLEGRDLHGLTCGVAGTGKIGRCFVDIARGCGMKIVLWDVFPDQAYARSIGAAYEADFKTFAAGCDVLSLHVPLTDATRHLVNREVLSAMRPDAVVLNTSRGPVIDTEALLEALLAGKLGGAGLDVYEREQAFFFEDRSGHVIRDPVLSRLMNMPNVVLTSHQAFLTTNALRAIAETTALNVVEVFGKGLRGAQLTNGVSLTAKL